MGLDDAGLQIAVTAIEDTFEIREIVTFGEIEACIDLQRATWQLSDVDVTPARLFVIARHGGTPPLGAFDASGRLVGFVHTLTASWEGRPAFYSHMLAVAEPYRDSGIGFDLKCAQRRQALAAGVELVVWTFDPLQSRNAHFNLNKLGAVVRRYVPNFYGEQHSSVFDAGIGSDRLFAEWWVSSAKTVRALAGVPELGAADSPAVEIPRDLNAIKRSSDVAARAWRLRVRQQFQERLAEGLIAVGLRRDADTSAYVFAAPEQVDAY